MAPNQSTTVCSSSNFGQFYLPPVDNLCPAAASPWQRQAVKKTDDQQYKH